MQAIAEKPPVSLVPLPPKPTLADIQQLEAALRDHPGRIEIETTHHFAEGIYAREIFIPAGAKLVGKIHRTAHLNIVSQGAIRVWTEDGEKIIRAPFAFTAKPGTKRVGEALEDTVWTTIHPNAGDEQDLGKLESLLIVPENNLTGGMSCPGLQ